MVEKLLLQLCYTVIQLPFKGFKKLLGGGGGRLPPLPPPPSVRYCLVLNFVPMKTKITYQISITNRQYVKGVKSI
jgi:hypothetical protein